MKNIKQDYCFTTQDVYETFDFSACGLKRCDKQKTNRKDTRREYCASILMYCLYLIILDIIKNNVTFVLPLFGGQEACFFVKTFEGETFKKMYSKGCFDGIDFLASNFKGYRICFQYTYKGGVREKPIYISHNLRDIFYENINNGKPYY